MTELSLEELANIRVTSVSKKSESIADAPASVFVITGNEIRRSGATTLPEALRLAPNLQVARSNARNYAITARGFNGTFANKLLVLIDGRTVYTPLFSGVFWDAQDVVLEDIDRIEVISGPGGTLWGANAVNGVINVITKAAADTQGGLVAVGASSNEKSGALRYGGALDNGGHYRVYGKYADHDDTKTAADVPILFGWSRQQAGFRTDWSNANQQFTLHGDAYDGALHQAGTRNITITGANLLGRMNTRLDGGSNVSLQAYWDFTERNQPGAFIEHLHTLDVQLQQSVQVARIHDIVWGAGYRLAMDNVQNSGVSFLPGKLNMYWGNMFVQDEIALRDNVRLTAGLKLENNNYTGVEYLPTVRLAWEPSENNLLWTAASRSVRAPSRFDRDILGAGLPEDLKFESEIANVLEIGYRAQPSLNFSYSATAFYSRYDELRTLELNPAGPALAFSNGAKGTTRGIEMWGSWQPASAWRLSAGLVAQRIAAELKPGRTDLTPALGLAPNDPSNYWMLRSSYDLAPGQELDLTVRHSGKLRSPAVPAYTAVDLRYGWKIRRDLELSVVGQNLLDSSHPEFDAAPNRSEYERSVFVKLVWRQ